MGALDIAALERKAERAVVTPEIEAAMTSGFERAWSEMEPDMLVFGYQRERAWRVYRAGFLSGVVDIAEGRVPR